jgi:hypothetical protein
MVTFLPFCVEFYVSWYIGQGPHMRNFASKIDSRVIMWDNTNIPNSFKASAADTQRNTYSAS